MHFLPILSTLRRHRTAAALIVLEIALTCAIVCNAIFLIRDRLARMDRPSGVAEDELVRVQLTGIGKRRRRRGDHARRTSSRCAASPASSSSTATNMVPFGDSSWNTDVGDHADDATSRRQRGHVHGHAGPRRDARRAAHRRAATSRPTSTSTSRTCRATRPSSASVIVTRGIADKLYPGPERARQADLRDRQGAADDRRRDRAARAAERGQRRGRRAYAMLLPIARPVQRRRQLPAARRSGAQGRGARGGRRRARQGRPEPRSSSSARPFDEIRREFFKQDRAMAYLLLGVSLALLVITALGVVGLASFWVQQRTRQIGIRRALGATRGRHPALLPGRELHPRDARHRARHGASPTRSTCG